MASTARGAEVFYAHGYHGGYFLTDERAYVRSLDDVFRLLDVAPGYKVLWELEPYTLQRMAGGERFACERCGRTEAELSWWALPPLVAGSGADHRHDSARSGQWGVKLILAGNRPYVNCCQPLPGAKLEGRKLLLSGWVRAHTGQHAQLYIDAHGEAGVIAGSSHQTPFALPDRQWHKLSLEFEVPRGARTLFPQAKIIRGPGEADFDDLSLRDAQSGVELLANGGFEETYLPQMKLPEYLEKLRQSIRLGRSEIVGGPYTQPIMYTIGAESTVRQFTYGCRAVQEALGTPVDFYAAQEPDMVAQLPQILGQLGFRGTLLRTHWCIFGSPPHRDAEAVWWVGPDGSRIAAVPAYASTPLRGYGLPGPSPALVERLDKAGVRRPLFSGLADLAAGHVPDSSWAPLQAKAELHFTTLAEYFERSGPPNQSWEDPYQDFEHRFPFGLLAGRPQHDDRRAENALLQTERLLAIAQRDGPADLHDAWQLALLGQHHDAWVCAPVIFGVWKRGYKTYADLTWQADTEALTLCRKLQEGLLRKAETRFTVINTSAGPRREVVEFSCALPPGPARKLAICDAAGRPVPASFGAAPQDEARSPREGLIRALVEVPPLGYKRYEIRQGDSPPLPEVRKESRGDQIVLSNETLRVTVGREGLLNVSNAQGEPLLASPAFLAGRFPEGELRSTIRQVGLGREGVIAEGRIGSVPFQATVDLDPLQPLVQLSLELDFGEGTLVGAAEEREPRMPSFAQDEQKLRLVVPVTAKSPRFSADGAFEIRAINKPRWPVLRYAAAEGDHGTMAVFTDRATAGVFSGEPASLGIVLAYGGKFLYAPAHAAPLRGRERFQLWLLFRRHDLASAGVPEAADVIAHPLLVSGGSDVFPQAEFSLVTVEPAAAAMVTAAYLEKGAIIARLWRPWPGKGTVRLKIAPARRIQLADLYGQPQRLLAEGAECSLPMDCNQIVTFHADL
jgi:hypothetical protein